MAGMKRLATGVEWLRKFVEESNKIEGILREPTEDEVKAHEQLLQLEKLEITHLEEFVKVVAPGNILRNKKGLDVYVGNHVPPPGGPEIQTELLKLLYAVNNKEVDPYQSHHLYETLHPFTDGNGRSGRAVWLWQMQQRHELNRVAGLGFLHEFYYQTLQAGQGNYK